MIEDKHILKELSMGGTKIPIWIYGDIKNPLIFFIHGYFRGFSEYVGDLPIKYLMKDYCLVAFDLPGFGKSRNVKMNRSIFILKVIQEIAKERKYFIFGISYGGLLAIKQGLSDSNKVKGMIIGGTPLLYGPLKLLSILSLIPFLRSKSVFPIAKDFTFLSKKNLGRIKSPVLLLYSSSDWKANSFMGRRLNKLIPSSKLYIAKGLSHSWLMHRVDKSGFLKEISEFLVKNR